MAFHPGKQVFRKRYIHVDALGSLSDLDQQRVEEAAKLAGVTSGRGFNVVRVEEDSSVVAFLHYRDFFDAPFPELAERWLVNLAEQRASYRTYESSLNPPILHRKELLLGNCHARWAEYAALTEAAEQVGLFDEPTRIGYRVQWEHLVRERGYAVSGHQLVALGNDVTDGPDLEVDIFVSTIQRHRTALSRSGFSAPIQALFRHGFLEGQHTIFDYGCGRGDDLRGLQQCGIQAAGWDPYFAPDGCLAPADLVNLGFVINVIEDFEERVEALTRAYSLSEGLLIVSVMLANDNAPGGIFLNDGVVTKRRTFQKYFTQHELKAFLHAVLDEEAIPVAPGVMYVFRDKDLEQRFLEGRYRGRRRRLAAPLCHPARKRTRRRKADEKFEQYRHILDRLWECCVRLGRVPEAREVPAGEEILDAFGSIGKAVRFLLRRNGSDAVEEARLRRTEDLTVHLALTQFEGRRRYKHMEARLRADIKAFFGSMRAASEAARSLLFQVADVELIEKACQQAGDRGLGEYAPGRYLQLHSSLVSQLPALLRVYIGCAAALYGDCQSADLVKIHVASGKLTLMRFDEFDASPLPRMVERAKVKLREHDIEYFNYDSDEYEPPYLYRKSRYINEEYPGFPEQLAFDEALESLPFVDLSGYGPSPTELHEVLGAHRWRIDGVGLRRVDTVPALDERCGKYLTYRQLIECGETQARTGIPNLPKNPDSYTALCDLAITLLDPVIEYFGMIKLTYGFCSPALAKQIGHGIAPHLDQHAAHETKKNSELICRRGGAAVDFVVEDEDMGEVAEWIIANLPFDRLYYYGPDVPLHVSFGPEHSRYACTMTKSPSGNLIPRGHARSH